MTTDKMIEQLTYFMEDSDPKTLELIVAKLRAAEEMYEFIGDLDYSRRGSEVRMNYRNAGKEVGGE